MGMNAFQQTVTTFVGQNSGARKYKNVGKIVGLTLICVTVVGIILGAGKSIVPMVVTILGACGLRIVWIYSIFYQITGITTEERLGVLFAVFPVSWAVTIVALAVCFLVIWKKRLKLPGNNG